MMSDGVVNITSEEALAAVPVANQAAAVTRSAATDELMITVPLRKPRLMVPPLSWILPYRKQRRIALDELGEEVYKACDGRRTTADIVEQFARHHDLLFHEARIPVMQFLRHLMRRGVIVVQGPHRSAAQGRKR